MTSGLIEGFGVTNFALVTTGVMYKFAEK